jgi:hypothetical protein
MSSQLWSFLEIIFIIILIVGLYMDNKYNLIKNTKIEFLIGTILIGFIPFSFYGIVRFGDKIFLSLNIGFYCGIVIITIIKFFEHTIKK